MSLFKEKAKVSRIIDREKINGRSEVKEYKESKEYNKGVSHERCVYVVWYPCFYLTVISYKAICY